MGSSAPQDSSSKLLSCYSIRNNFSHVAVPFKASQLAESLLIGSSYPFQFTCFNCLIVPSIILMSCSKMACYHCYLRSNHIFLLKKGQSAESGGYLFFHLLHSLYSSKIILFRSQPTELLAMHEGDSVTKYLSHL